MRQRRPSFVPPEVDQAWFAQQDHQRRLTPVIEIRGLSVRYGATPGERSLASFVGLARRRSARREVWALRDLYLTVRPGECLAVVGRNGAGKSTLLRVMARLIDHDTGTIRTRGRISALLNLGVGFDPRFTGRENVELVGSLMGLSRTATRERMPEVTEFADIGDFIDAPLRTYSTGMRARLGFATVAAMIEPHVLVLDEVMGTGDAAFKERSRERVMELVQRAHAVVVASHDMSWVAEFATYAVLLERGSIFAEGAPSGVATLHRARSARTPQSLECQSCSGNSFDAYCARCGVLRSEPGDSD